MRRRLEAQLELLEPHHKGIKLLLKKMTNIKRNGFVVSRNGKGFDFDLWCVMGG
ncbi:unnamed protein product [Linum tenue]|uniref:Uncharacterized protein n=1 Tax=Linum tenue TaxID=586396 RepID=A0AAV0NEZ2_9ROSI|nr:unnamed protein product [Linum tenue]CAI0457180.1 unnamed protein product [Linum tenue]